jgi:predicted helicase
MIRHLITMPSSPSRKAGRELAHWHLELRDRPECVPGRHRRSHLARDAEPQLGALSRREKLYRVTQNEVRQSQKDPGDRQEPSTTRPPSSTTTSLTLKNIPLSAYDYVVNGKPALEWVMERQSVTTDKDSGITNDANLWATETMGNAKYPLELFLRVVTVSLETNRIVNALPPLNLD